ncbi:hypothetical protein ACA910_019440 [Epithemia clementina (nom. ined.)]
MPSIDVRRICYLPVARRINARPSLYSHNKIHFFFSPLFVSFTDSVGDDDDRGERTLIWNDKRLVYLQKQSWFSNENNA